MIKYHGQTHNYTAGPLHFGGSNEIVNMVRSGENSEIGQMVAINVESDTIPTSYDLADYSEDCLLGDII